MLSAATPANRMTTSTSPHNQEPSQNEEYTDILATTKGKAAGGNLQLPTHAPGTLPALERSVALAEGYSGMFYSDGTDTYYN